MKPDAFALARLLPLAAALVLGFLALAPSPDAGAQNGLRHIHEERSVYRNILVTEDSQRRCLRFTITRLVGQNQSCRYLRDPQRLVFPYAKMTLSSLLVRDDPKRIFIVGLGGGTLVEAYSTLFPEAEILISEIDEAVVRVARDYFVFEETDRIHAQVGDGRVHVKRLAMRGEKFDLVILDAFNGEYIPEHMMTREFLEEASSLLSEDGMLVANTFSTSRLYDAESATYESVFGEIFSLSMSGTGNRVVIATPGKPLPSQDELRARVPEWRERLRPFDMDVADYVRYMDTERDWNPNARLLTDQYSPANLLNE